MLKNLKSKKWGLETSKELFHINGIKTIKIINMKVVHCKKEPYDVYIGRAPGERGKWGNPFTHKKDSTQAKYFKPTRKEAVEAYRDYILNGEGKHLLDDLDELEGKVLGCWCGSFTPEDKDNLRCHGQILMEIIESRKQIKLF